MIAAVSLRRPRQLQCRYGSITSLIVSLVRLNHLGKTVIWSLLAGDAENLANIVADGAAPNFADWFRLVGYGIQCVGLDNLSLLHKCVESALPILRRLEYSPFDIEKRAHLAAAVAASRVDVGLSICRPEGVSRS